MSTVYSATYYPAGGYAIPVKVIVTPVTISLLGERHGMPIEVYWLAVELTGFEEQPLETVLYYKNKEGQEERLVVREATLVAELKKQLSYHRLVGQPHRRVFGSIWIKLLVLTGALVAILLVAYLWWAPALGERVAKGFSKEQEINLGEQLYNSLKPTFTIDAKKTKLLNEFYQELHYDIGYPVQITVVRSDIINAFAIPGGHIVVYEAILDRMKTPEELAALLAHEASHVALRHSLRNLFRGLARRMFLAILMGNQGGIVSIAVSHADELKGLAYSRSLETEADDNGLVLMAKNQVDVQGMERLMELLQQETKGQEPAAILSTHPIFKDRIAHIQARIKALPAGPATNPALKEIFHNLY